MEGRTAKKLFFRAETWLLGLVVPLLLATVAVAQPSVADLEWFWTPEGLVLSPRIEEPFRQETVETLQAGLPVALDLDIQFIRTGFVKREYRRFIIEYSVWSGEYRIRTPQKEKVRPESFSDLIRYLERKLTILIDSEVIPGTQDWFVKVRVGDRAVLKEESEAGRIEDELSGLAGWLFRRGKPRERYSEWSDLEKILPRPRGEEGAP